MTANEISGVGVNTVIEIRRELGPGLLESVYELLLAEELVRRGLNVERQVFAPVTFRGRRKATRGGRRRLTRN